MWLVELYAHNYRVSELSDTRLLYRRLPYSTDILFENCFGFLAGGSGGRSCQFGWWSSECVLDSTYSGTDYCTIMIHVDGTWKIRTLERAWIPRQLWENYRAATIGLSELADSYRTFLSDSRTMALVLCLRYFGSLPFVCCCFFSKRPRCQSAGSQASRRRRSQHSAHSPRRQSAPSGR